MNTKRYAGMAVAGLVIGAIVLPFALIAWSIVGIRSLVERSAETAEV